MYNLFDFSSLLYLTGGLPLYGEIEYPNDLRKDAAFVDMAFSLRSSITFYIKMIFLSLFFDWSKEYIISLEKYSATFNPLTFGLQSIHSIGLGAGIRI